MRLVLFCVSLALASPAVAALSIATNGDVAAGKAAFGAAQPLLSWANAFAPGTTWSLGVFGGATSQAGVVADSVTGASATASNYVTNWIDGPGFDAGALAAPDLAINGPEDVLFSFTAPVRRIGFAIATGRGLLPSQASGTGTSFTLRTSAGESGELTMIDSGNGQVLWVDVSAATAFTSLRFTENTGDLTDQYFGDFLAGNVAAGVPEPAAWAMLLGGFGAVGVAMRRRPAIRTITA